MKKINLCIKHSLINANSEYNIKGILNFNKIMYFDNDIKMIIDLENKIMYRIKDKEEIILNFNDLKCTIYDKMNNINLEMEIDVLKIEVDNERFYVKYRLNENEICVYEIKIINEIY